MNFHRKVDFHPPGFNITPLLDILLVLIIFFILTWSFSRDERDLTIQVPSAKHAEPSRPVPGEIILNIMPDGTIKLNQRTLNKEELKDILTRVIRDFPEQVIIVRADGEVPYKNIIAILDIASSANVKNISFATRPEESSSDS
jgi:biopolymer transport protein ExbD